jgi:hypothetical protein
VFINTEKFIIVRTEQIGMSVIFCAVLFVKGGYLLSLFKFYLRLPSPQTTSMKESSNKPLP